MDAEALVRTIRRIVRDTVDDEGIGKVTRYATISSSYSSGKPRLRFDGESADTLKTYPHLASYAPVAGDRVMVARGGRSDDWVVLGRVGGSPQFLRLTGGTLTGKLTTAAIDLNGLIRFRTQTWHQDMDGLPRLYFGANTHTYFRSGGTGGFFFRNAGNSNILTIASNGDMVSDGEIRAHYFSTHVSGAQDRPIFKAHHTIDSGMYSLNSDGSLRFTVDGNLRFDIRASTNTLFEMVNFTSFQFFTPRTGNIFDVRDEVGGSNYPSVRLLQIPTQATTTSAANVHCTSAGNINYVTSSQAAKTDIEDIQPEFYHKVLALRPVWHRSLAVADRPDWSFYGLLAEDLHEAGLSQLVMYRHKDGPEAYEEAVESGKEYDPDDLVPHGIMYDRVAVLALAMLQEQERRIRALEEELSFPGIPRTPVHFPR